MHNPVRIENIAKVKRIPELDGLRGVAILLVVCFHYINNQLVNNENPIAKVLCKVSYFGWIGVDLFFVLSGFLIGGILLANRGSQNYFKTFYIRRLVRIVPNYFLLLICFVLIWNLTYFQGNYFFTSHNNIPLWSYFLMVHNFYMAHYCSLGNDALSITWSIGIEEQFYLVFPLLVFYINEKWISWVLGIMIVFAIGFRSQFEHWVPRYVLLPSRLDGLAVGFLVAYFNYNGSLKAFKNRLIWSLPVILVIDVAVCGFLYWKYTDLGAVRHTLFAVAFAILLIMALLRSDSLYGIILRNKILVWIGTISYSLYLFHYMILGLFHWAQGHTNIGISNTGDIILSIGAFLFSILFSWLIYRVLEQPMVKLGKRAIY